MSRSFILWKASYSVGVEHIDNQHKKLLEILNNLYESFTDRSIGKKMETIFEDLFDYTNYHFNTEEELFKKANYPKQEEHIEEHQEFIQKLNKFKSELKEGDYDLTIQLMNFLKNWLVNHISISDQDYASHFRIKGIT